MCPRFRSGASSRAPISKAWSAARCAGRCSAGAGQVTREALAEVVASFLPSTEGVEKELQEMAAILECTDTQFLPPEIVAKVEAPEAAGSCRSAWRLAAVVELT